MNWLGDFHWKQFLTKLREKFLETDLLDRSAQVGFYFSFAFFPLLLFLITLFGLILDKTDTLQNELYSYLAGVMPGSAYRLVHTTMDEIIASSSGSKLTVGIVATLWSASAGVDSLRSALEAVYQVDDDAPWWKLKLQSLLFTLMFIVLLAVALTIITAGVRLAETGAGAFGSSGELTWLLLAVQWVLLFIVLLLVTAAIYNWLPSHCDFRWVWVSPGSLVAIVLWAILTAGFKTYLHFFNSYNKAYGSLGAVIILMLWMYLTGLALLVGGAINSVLASLDPSTDVRQDLSPTRSTHSAKKAPRRRRATQRQR